MRTAQLIPTGAALLLLAFALALGVSSAWKPAAPILEDKSPPVDPNFAAVQTRYMCAQAKLELPGVHAAMSCAELYPLLKDDFGEAATTLYEACLDRRVLPADDLLFLPTASLCGQAALPDPCSELCGRWGP